MCRCIIKSFCYFVLVVLALVTSLIAWSSTKEVPEGHMFATLIPLMQGSLPQTIFGRYVTPLTPPVPAGSSRTSWRKTGAADNLLIGKRGRG
mgnify:CR=1 FL=1